MSTLLKRKTVKKPVGFNHKEVSLLISMVQHNADVYKSLSDFDSPQLGRLLKKLEQLKSE